MTDQLITDVAIDAATVETSRLCRELDITNADHIALWLEANDDVSLGYLACRIIEAHEAKMRFIAGMASDSLSWALAEIRGTALYEDARQRARCVREAQRCLEIIQDELKGISHD